MHGLCRILTAHSLDSLAWDEAEKSKSVCVMDKGQGSGGHTCIALVIPTQMTSRWGILSQHA